MALASVVFDLKALKTFLSVAEFASMTAAARRLGLSQSAVSQAIRQLEESAGVVLFDRDRRPLTLTVAGTSLRKRGTALVEEAEALYKTVREQSGTEAQLLRIGMVDSFASTIGPPLIKSLLSSAVHLHVASGPGLGAALRERRLDIIVTSDPLESDLVLERHRIMSEPFVLLLARSLSRPTPNLTLDQLARSAPLVRFNFDSHIGATIERYLGERGVVPARRLEIDSADSLVAMVAETGGWALITPMCLLQARVDAEAVMVVPLPGTGMARELTLLARRGEYGALPERIAATAGRIFDSQSRLQLKRLAPWLADAVTVGCSQ